MAIGIKQLIQLAPFPEDRRRALIENLDKMTEDQKYRIINVAWYALAQIYFAKLEAERQKLMDEVVHDEKKINPNDIEEIEAKLLYEFVQKLETTESEKSVEEIKQQLEKFKIQPLPQDKVSPSPPQMP